MAECELCVCMCMCVCVWAQLVSQYTSAPVSESPFGLKFGQRSLSCLQLYVPSQYFDE